jgi:hypothetical protein
MKTNSFRISYKNFAIFAEDGFRYQLTKRFFNLYAYLALQRMKDPLNKGGFVEIDHIQHLPLWKKNSFLSTGKQIRRHIIKMGSRNIIESEQKVKGRYRLQINPKRIKFDVDEKILRGLLGLDELDVFFDRSGEKSFYKYVEEMSLGNISFNGGDLEKALACFQRAKGYSNTFEQEVTASTRIGGSARTSDSV